MKTFTTTITFNIFDGTVESAPQRNKKILIYQNGEVECGRAICKEKINDDDTVSTTMIEYIEVFVDGNDGVGPSGCFAGYFTPGAKWAYIKTR